MWGFLWGRGLRADWVEGFKGLGNYVRIALYRAYLNNP